MFEIENPYLISSSLILHLSFIIRSIFSYILHILFNAEQAATLDIEFILYGTVLFFNAFMIFLFEMQ
ncbi:hypothetical protein XNC1_0722 [Xenorhabdus nematophila ATCC 19061]|uniref:Uncharacterized protein n=1 Tax=Xenorhabdus nematophila (strain ATCC 19061 / DSM 3370 / CCUG 14189 / LMG 1036 / NCIMB 9965 / AN6) TaxID=406817 RepID=D3VJN7_XENNA|nr:hypothetical protein XNC1_0722 [Xenorhabdus nematophila ATCC 19061]